MHSSSINVLIFNFCLLHVSNPRAHLQEDSCTYGYGMVRLVGRRMCLCNEHPLLPTRHLTLMHVKCTTP